MNNNNNNNSYKDKCIPIPEDSTNNTNNTNKAINTYFDIDECILGKGSFGEVCKGKLKEDKNELLQRFNIPKGVDIAIKKILKHKFDMNEINILFKIKDLKYITKYYGCLYDDNYIYIIMEYIQGEELFNYIYGKTQDEDNNPRQLTLEEIQKVKENRQRIMNNLLSISKQLAIAIVELHKLGIIHNDIKPENIMVIENGNNLDIKLIDYGLSCDKAMFDKCLFFTSDSISLKGTPDYMSAQFLKNYDYDDNNTYYDILLDNPQLINSFLKKKDWWSYIVMIFELIFNDIPDENEIKGNLSQNKLNFLSILNKRVVEIVNLISIFLDENIFIDYEHDVISENIIATLGIPSIVRGSSKKRSANNTGSKSPTKTRKTGKSPNSSTKKVRSSSSSYPRGKSKEPLKKRVSI